MKNGDVQFFSRLCRNGAPPFNTTPAKMYSKHEVRNSAVFSEFLMLECPWFTLGGIYQGCSFTVMYAMACTATQIIMMPSNGVRTLRETKFAVGRLRSKVGAGPAQPIKIAMGKMRSRSMKRNWKSPRFDAFAYKKLTEVNWMAEYRLMYLKQLKLVTRAALPSLPLQLVRVLGGSINLCKGLEDLPNHLKHASNVKHPGGKWSSHRCFCFRQRYADIGSL